MITFYVSVWLMLAVIAQAIGDWWQTPVGRSFAFAVSIAAAIGVIAAAVKGVRYLIDQGVLIQRWGSGKRRERQRRELLLDELLAPEGWPVLVTLVDDLRQEVAHLSDSIHALLEHKE